MMTETLGGNRCQGCEETILTDYEEHYTDDFGEVWHHWCADEVKASEANDLAEELAIQEAREDGDL